MVTCATTKNYVAGVACLAKSIALFPRKGPDSAKNPYRQALTTNSKECLVLQLLPLLVYCSPSAAAALRTLSESCGIASLIEICALPEPDTESDGAVTSSDNSVSTHNGKGARIAFDAPRRILWSNQSPFVYIDADIVCVRSPWEGLLEEIKALLPKDEQLKEKALVPALSACPAFRIKKKQYNSGGGGYFNAGLVICVQPKEADYKAIAAAVSHAVETNAETTEEQLLGEVFRTRWRPLHPKFNVVKRVAKFAPQLWSELSSSAIFLHYIGAKPWLPQKTKVAMDWDADGYEPLESLWHDINDGKFDDDAEKLTRSFMSVDITGIVTHKTEKQKEVKRLKTQ